MKPTVPVDLMVSHMAARNVQRFTAPSIVRQTGLDPQRVFERLWELVDDTTLILVLDAFCPQCDTHVQRLEQTPTLPLDLECLGCGLPFPVKRPPLLPALSLHD